MSFLDKAKEKAQQAAELAKEQAEVAKAKAKEAADKAAHKIEETGLVDKAASAIDGRTGGKYSDKIAKAASTAKDSVGKMKAGETVTDMEYSTTYGAEPTESASDAAQVFQQEQ